MVGEAGEVAVGLSPVGPYKLHQWFLHLLDLARHDFLLHGLVEPCRHRCHVDPIEEEGDVVRVRLGHVSRCRCLEEGLELLLGQSNILFCWLRCRVRLDSGVNLRRREKWC